MTDETLEPAIAPERPAISYKTQDGEWRELARKRRETGDPELDALWAMSFGELQKILDDDSHPLYQKAKQVAAEAMKPIMDAFDEITRPLTESVAKSLDFSKMFGSLGFKNLMPTIDTSSWTAKLLPNIPTFDTPQRWIDSVSPERLVASQHPLEQVLPGDIDFDAVDPPDASLRDIQEAAEAHAHEMRSRMIDLLTEMVKEARAGSELSQDTLKETRSSKRAGWTAAIVAAVVGVGGIVVTLASR